MLEQLSLVLQWEERDRGKDERERELYSQQIAP